MSERISFLVARKWWAPAAAVAGLLLVILFALGFIGGPDKVGPGRTDPSGMPLPHAARTLSVHVQATPDALAWQGSVRSRSVAKISAKLNARISEVLVHAGDRVNKGDVIARLDDRDLRAAYQAASAALTAAQAQAGQAGADEKRMTELYQKQAATRQNYDAALAQAKAARALAAQAAGAAQQAKVMLGENVLYAPFAGVVGERLKEPGDLALPGEPVVLMHKPEDLRFEAAIASHCFGQVRLGLPVTVRIDALARELPATVDEIAPEIDPQTHTRLIKANLQADPDLQHGQFGWLQLGCQAERQALLIPHSAVLHYGQLQAVRVVEGQYLHTRHIRTGKQYGEQLEVLSGLRDGETILVDSELAP